MTTRQVRARSLTTALLLAVTLGAAGCSVSGAGADDPLAAPATLALPAEAVRVEVSPTIHPIGSVDEPRLPVTVASADGVEVTVTDTSRILAVDLYGTLAETVFSLGLGADVVGRDSSTGFAEAASLPLVTVGGHSLSAEAVLDLNPTVVLTDTTIGPPEVLEQLRDAGIPVIFFDPTRTLDGIGPQIEAVATALGVPGTGHALAERTRSEIDQALTRLPEVTSPSEEGSPTRIAFLYVRGSAVALMGGPGSGADELITAIGAQDAGTTVGLTRPFTQITSEALVTAAPDVLLLLDGGLASVDGIDGLLRVPGVGQTPAGVGRHVVTVEDTALLTFGPRTGATLEALAAAVRQATRSDRGTDA